MVDRSPCGRCRQIIASGGVFLIEILPDANAERDGSIEAHDAKRTGRVWGSTHAAHERIFGPPPDKGVSFVSSDAADLVFGTPDERRFQ
jgi:hypothetical protein